MTGICCFIGLGNPGASYAKTRHNVGQWWIDAIATQSSATFKLQNSLKSHSTSFTNDHQPRWLVKPTTYMNESGQSVRAFTHFYKILPEQLLIVHDEIDLPLGAVRLKFGGGHGGHNGLRSIIEHLGTPNFHRLRLGVGHPGHADEVSNHVLDRMSKTEETTMHEIIDTSITVLPLLLTGNFSEAMRILHTQK